MLLNKRFSPSNEELCSKPDLKLALEKIREIKQQYLQAHPEEAPDRVSLYFAGAVAEEYISPIKNVFPRTRTKTRRNSYTHFLAKSLLGKSSKTPRVMKKIAKEYETLKANNEEFAQLKKEADEFNKAFSTRPVNLARTLQQQAIKALVRQAGWLLDEFNSHIVPKFYASSDNSLKKQAASGVFQRLVKALVQKAAGNHQFK
ncbi:hypothetical protein EDC96DRAFT_532592 [Choanephora cucurbitarum]|nr:hypothetical protein EDC96DRAFT_532592 [Choanephora cucurbitarum]